MAQLKFFDWLFQYAQSHKYAVLFSVIGFIAAVLILIINFWRTLLLFAIVGICLFAGMLVDKGGFGALREFLDRILPRR